MASKYPYDIVSIVRKKTFSVEAHLIPDFETSPLKVFDDTFSRFVFTILDRESEQKVAYMNIHIDELPRIKAVTDIAFASSFQREALPPPEFPDAPLVTSVRFRMGKVKGKTPYEILSENYENGSQLLNNQYTFLAKGVDDYPDNRQEMEAILQASKLDPSVFKKKDQETGKSTSPFVLFEQTARPLTRKTDESGRSFCYEGKVTWIPGQNYPVEAQISNYYAPVVKKENGLLNVQVSKKTMETRKSFVLTDSEWLAAVEAMKRAVDAFYISCFARAYQTSEESARARRDANQQEKETA
jgi:hypothetical protein